MEKIETTTEDTEDTGRQGRPVVFVDSPQALVNQEILVLGANSFSGQDFVDVLCGICRFSFKHS